MLSLGEYPVWEPPILETVAVEGTGVGAVWDAVLAHASALGGEGIEARRRARRMTELETAFVDMARRRAAAAIAGSDVAASVAAGEIDPWTGARLLGD